jgi:hypothetical protein
LSIPALVGALIGSKLKTYLLAGNLKKCKGQKLSKGRGAWPTILSILDFYAKDEQDARLKNRYRKL